MKTITTFIILFVLSYQVTAQDLPSVPTRFNHNGDTVQFYPNIIYLVLTSKAVNITLLKVVSDSKMTFSEPTDTMMYTTNSNNRWLRKMNGDHFTIKEISTLQTKFDDGVIVSPAYYTPTNAGDERIFAPLPNVLVLDREFVTDKVVQYLKQLDVIINKERTQEQVVLTIFDVPLKRFTVFEIQQKLIEKFPKLDKHVRFENQPLVSQRLARMSMSQPITAQGPLDQWNLDIIKSDPSQFTNTTAVKIGLIEMGCDLTHASLNLVDGITMGDLHGEGSSTNQLHGTEMAGIIGAKSNSSRDIRGVTPYIQIVPVARTTETDVEVAAAITYCITHHVNVINMSFGRDASGRIAGGPTWNFANIDGTLTRAHDNNIVLVAAAGNGFSSSGVEYPAKHPNVMAIGASDKHDKLLVRSNYGDLEYLGKTVGISVLAPGGVMYVTVPGGSINEIETGTSGATAHVTALAALLKSIKPSLTADSIRYIIESTTDKVDDRHSYRTMPGFVSGTRNVKYGYGRVNIENALAFVNYHANVTPPDIRVIPGPGPNPEHNKKFPWLWIILILLVIVIIIVLASKKKKNKK